MEMKSMDLGLTIKLHWAPLETNQLVYARDGQSSIPGNGGTEGGSIGDRGIIIHDALTYVMTVKETFQDQRDRYDMFLEDSKDFNAHRTDTPHVMMAQIKELFKGRNHLIIRFNTFLPPGFEITLHDEDYIEKEEASSFTSRDS